MSGNKLSNNQFSQYGRLIEPYNVNTEILYRKFVEYYGNPAMTKVSNSQNLSIYYVKIKTFLAKGYRYLIAMVPLDVYNLGISMRLSDLRWLYFQTRNLLDNKYLADHSYISRQGILDQKIVLTERTEQYSSYNCEVFPLKIHLLHQVGELYEYSNTGTIVSALETYNTIVSIQKEKDAI